MEWGDLAKIGALAQSDNRHRHWSRRLGARRPARRSAPPSRQSGCRPIRIR